MDIFSIGSLNTYTKNLKLQTQWNLKKQSGDVTRHSKNLDEWLQVTQLNEKDEEEIKRDKLRGIMSKLYAGAKLTQDEQRYLQANDPQAYQKLKSIEQEQKSYEQELKRCKTKEDVQRLRMSRLGASLQTVKSIENNPNIGIEKKLELVTQEKYKCDKLAQSTEKFVKSGEYEKLPTEAEQAKAQKEEKEAQAAQRGQDTSKTPQEDKKPAAEKPESATDKVEASKTSQKPEPEEKPRIEPESPEARKVRRAKAKSAYTTPPDLTDANVAVLTNSVSVKA